MTITSEAHLNLIFTFFYGRQFSIVQVCGIVLMCGLVDVWVGLELVCKASLCLTLQELAPFSAAPFTFPPAIQEASRFFIFSPTLIPALLFLKILPS
jgi:hypothetical protein